MAEIAGFSKENAKIILEVVRYLRSSGFIMQPPARYGQFYAMTSPIYFRNDSGEVVPPFACLQSIGTAEAENQNYILIDKPADNTGAAGPFIFNGLREVEIGGYGIAHDGPMVRMLTDGAAMTASDKARPVVNQWYVELGGDLFTVIGDDDIETDVVRGMIGGGGLAMYRFETTADYSTGTSVGAEILTMGGTVVTASGTISDPDQIFLGIANGTKGLAIYQAGTYYIIQAACGA